MASHLREIARRAAVSVSTVSRVLAGEATYRRAHYADRAARIRAIADELGYRPSLAARAIRTGRFGTIVLIGGLEPGVGHLGPQLIDGVCAEAATHGLLVYVTRQRAADLIDERRLPLMLRKRAVDGILLSYTHHVPEALDDLDQRLNLPVIWLNRSRERDAVRFADEEAAREATALLIARGHRRILLYASGVVPSDPAGHYAAPERCAGYHAAMAEAGLTPLVRYLPPDRDADFHARTLYADLAGPHRPTAALCLADSDLVVYGAQRAGLRVPEDFCVATFTRYRDKDHQLPVARLQVPDHLLGSHGLGQLVRRIADPARHEPAVRLPVPLLDDRFLPPPGPP